MKQDNFPLLLKLAVIESSEPTSSWMHKNGFKINCPDDWPKALAAWKICIAKELIKNYRNALK